MSGLVFWEISGQSRLSILGDIRSVQAQYFGRYQVSSGSVFGRYPVRVILLKILSGQI